MKSGGTPEIKYKDQAGGLVINPDGEVLLVTNRKGRLTLPKGTKKPEDTSDQSTALREIGEESGIEESDLTIHRDLGPMERPGGSRDGALLIKRIRFFLCSTEQMELGPLEADVMDAGWFGRLAVPDMLFHPEEARFFKLHMPALQEIADLEFSNS